MPSSFADARSRVVEADLAELQLELLADLDRRLRRELLDRALLEHAEVVEVDVRRAPTRKNRRFVGSSSSRSRAAAGPTTSAAIFAFSSTLNAFAREPGVTSARSLRSISTAVVASETTIPSPAQVGHLRVMTSRGPSVTFWRVISTRPSGEISTT